MNTIKIALAQNKKDLESVFNIRKIVFIKEQKVLPEIERDEFDRISKHFLLFYKNHPAGCARIRFIGGKAKLERIAVLKKYRGEGFGKIIVAYLVKYCKKRKMKLIFMNAQYYLRDYYAKLGFAPTGKVFSEAGIKHIKMNYTR